MHGTRVPGSVRDTRFTRIGRRTSLRLPQVGPIDMDSIVRQRPYGQSISVRDRHRLNAGQRPLPGAVALNWQVNGACWPAISDDVSVVPGFRG